MTEPTITPPTSLERLGWALANSRVRLAIGILLLLAMGFVWFTHRSVEVKGTLDLKGASSFTSLPNQSCAGAGGYSDISIGTQVVVTDEAGSTIGVGQLTNAYEVGGFGVSAPLCMFGFDVQGIPSGHAFYGVEVASRGVVQFKSDQIGNAGLTLGSS